MSPSLPRPTLHRYRIWASNLFETMARWILRHRWSTFLSCCLATVCMAVPATSLQFNNTNEHFYPDGDPALAVYDGFKERFGNDEFVFILFSSPDFKNPGLWTTIEELRQELEQKVPFVAQARALTNLEILEGEEDELFVRKLMPSLPKTREEVQAALDKVVEQPLYVGQFLSRDQQFSGILLEMQLIEGDGDPRKTIAPQVREILDQRAGQSGLKFHVVGVPILDYDVDQTTAREILRFGAVSVLVALLLIGWLFRSLSSFLVTGFVVLGSLAWVFGTMSLLGMEMSLVSVIIPSLLVAVGLGDAVHLITEFRMGLLKEPDAEKALLAAVRLVAWLCLLTSLTTSAGLISFSWSPVIPLRQLGALCCFGVGMAFLITFTGAVALLALWPPQAAPNLENAHAEAFLHKVNELNRKRPRLILGVCLLCIFWAGWQSTQIRVETSLLEQMHPSTRLRQDYEAVKTGMGGVISMELMVGPPEGDAAPQDWALDLDLLQKLEAFEKIALTYPEARYALSLADLLKELNRALHNGDPNEYRLPDSTAAIAQYLLLYESAGGKELQRVVDFERRYLRLSIRTPSLGSQKATRMLDFLERAAREVFGDAAQVRVTGTIPLFMRLNEMVQTTQFQSLSLAFVLISLMMMAVFASWRLGLLSMLPNLLPILITLGYMGWSGTALDMGTVLIACVAIGVAVDDTIHFFSRVQLEFGEKRQYRPAIEASILHVGRAMFFTSLLLFASFGVLSFSVMGSVSNFGILTSITVVTAVLADYFFAAQTLTLFQPMGPESRSES